MNFLVDSRSLDGCFPTPRPLIRLRSFVLWLLVLAVPVQALAAPGWLCAKAGHHGASVVAAQPHHDHERSLGQGQGAAPVDHGSHDHHAFDHVDDPASLSVAGENDHEPAQPLPNFGKCSACIGCAGSVAGVPPSQTHLFAVKSGLRPVDHVALAIVVGSCDELFRPPRTLTL